MSERLYALTRIKAGDYLLPSNDLQILWRIYRYEEDSAYSENPGTSWGYAKYRYSTIGAVFNPNDLDDWGAWETYATSFPTRQAAIDDALHERVTS